MNFSFSKYTVISVTILLATTAHAQISVQGDSIYNNYHMIDTTVLGIKNDVVKTFNSGHSYKIVTRNNKLVQLAIDGKNIDKDSLHYCDSSTNKVRAFVINDELQGEKDRAQGEQDRQQTARNKKQIAGDKQSINTIINYLINEEIISDKKSLSEFILTDSALIINGKQQPEAYHHKLKEQYASWAHYGFSYGDKQMPGTTVFLNKKSTE